MISSPASDHLDALGDGATRRLMQAIAVIAVAAAALWTVMSLTYPFGWDQGLFAWVGGVILRGGMPYADAWDLKGPFVYYTYALAQAVFGAHLWSVRVVDLLLLAAATAAIFRAADGLTNRTVARWTALFFFLWYASHSYWHTAQPDGWAGMLLIIAVAPLLSQAGNATPGQLAWLGFAVGLATLCKPLYGALLLPPLAYVAVTATGGRRLAGWATVVGGWTACLAVAAGWFAWRGALDDLIAVHIRYSALYAGLRSGSPLRGLVDYFLSTRVVAPALPLVLYGGLLLWRRRRPVAILLGSWALLVTIGVAAQNRFFAYHWLPMLPAVTLLGAVALEAIYARLKVFASLIVVVLLVACLAPVVLEEARFASWLAGRIDRDTYYDGYGEPGSDMRAARWLHDQPGPGDVFVFGWNGGVAWLSGRTMVSRFGFSMPLLIGPPDIRSQYRTELLETLRAHPPRYILVGTQSAQIIGQVTTLDDFPELASLVRADYRERVRFGTITVHEIAR